MRNQQMSTVGLGTGSLLFPLLKEDLEVERAQHSSAENTRDNTSQMTSTGCRETTSRFEACAQTMFLRNPWKGVKKYMPLTKLHPSTQVRSRNTCGNSDLPFTQLRKYLLSNCVQPSLSGVLSYQRINGKGKIESFLVLAGDAPYLHLFTGIN